MSKNNLVAILILCAMMCSILVSCGEKQLADVPTKMLLTEVLALFDNNENVDITVNVTGCAFNNIPENSHEIYILYKFAGWTLNADGVNAFWK